MSRNVINKQEVRRLERLVEQEVEGLMERVEKWKRAIMTLRTFKRTPVDTLPHAHQ